MTTNIKQEIFQHYLDAGVPEIYAAIAAEEHITGKPRLKASETLMGSFLWDESVLGHDFWYGICDELQHESA